MNNYIGNLFPPSSFLRQAKEDSDAPFKKETLAFPPSDLKDLMSGRCAIHLALETLDLPPEDRIAYLPAYTCETVLAPFHALNYRLRFYAIDEAFRPHFESERLQEAKLLLITGYYGRKSYQEAFLDERPLWSEQELVSTLQPFQRQGLKLFMDLTHSIFDADPFLPGWDVAAASLRKWLPIASGGLAMIREGRLKAPALPVHEAHVALREELYDLAEAQAPQLMDCFWKGERLLRRLHGSYASDEDSALKRQLIDRQTLVEKRRVNVLRLEKALPKSAYFKSGALAFTLPFGPLGAGACPSHFTVLSDQRDALQRHFEAAKIHSSIYWPLLEDLPVALKKESRRITDRVLSLPIDQRYGNDAMERIIAAFHSFLAEDGDETKEGLGLKPGGLSGR